LVSKCEDAASRIVEADLIRKLVKERGRVRSVRISRVIEVSLTGFARLKRNPAGFIKAALGIRYIGRSEVLELGVLVENSGGAIV
jgi:hypothetical protein